MIPELPTVQPADTGHPEHHAALKADYDQRHPDAPLPEGDGLDVHRLLAIDHNATTGGHLWTETQPATLGHAEAHATLHAAYNARHH